MMQMKPLDAGGLRVGVFDRGSGPTLLLVHGFPLDHSMWEGQAEDLAQDFRVIAPDLRGFGCSDVTEGEVPMERFADDLAALLDRLDGARQIAFCGLSMGGYIAWEFWRRHRSRLSHLILCDTRAEADSSEAAAARRQTADRILAEGTSFLADSMAPKLFSPQSLHRHPELVRQTEAVMRATPAAGAAAAMRGMAARRDAVGVLGQIDIPTLVLCGQHDALTSADQMRAMAERIPGARFVEVPDAGHLSPRENPSAVNHAIRQWFDSLSNARETTSP